jgi:hypothetical protein
MTMKKTLTIALAACACLAALAPAGATAASKPKVGKFWLEVNGTQVTTWETKQHNTYYDCQGQRWTRGKGEEVIDFRTKKIKALVTLRNGHLMVKYGNWHPFKQGDYYIRGKGRVEREGERIFGIEPAECFDAGDPTEESGPYDCRSIPVTYDVDIDFPNGAIKTEASPMITTHPKFEKCPIVTPTNILGAVFEEVESDPFPYKDLFAKKLKYHEILGSKDFTYDDKRHTTAFTKVRWTVRLRRVN